VLSPPLSVVTSGKGCGDSSSLRNQLTLSLIGKMSDGQSCVGFIQEDSDPWNCLSRTEISKKERGLTIYRSKTSHLT